MFKSNSFKFGKGKRWIVPIVLLATSPTYAHSAMLSHESIGNLFDSGINQQAITGRVVDASSGEGIAGVTIVVKGGTLSS